MIGGPEAPRQYGDATEDNPLTFGLNSERWNGRWTTRCDGMPTMLGCGEEIETSVPYSRPSEKLKPSGWLICYGKDWDGTSDRKIVLAFCPSCAEHVLRCS